MNALVQLPSFVISPVAAATHRLYQAFVGVRQAQPTLGLKGWSRLLSCSEGELQASRLGQEAVQPLVDVFSLLYQLAGLGEVELSSFNESGWARWTGRFAPPDLCLDCPGYLGLEFRADSLRLQLNLEQWYWGCAVENQPEGKALERSLEFFNQAGERFIKIKATESTSQQGWVRLLERFARSDVLIQPLFAALEPAQMPSTPVEVASFNQDWRLMQSSSQIPRLLKRYQASYLGGLQVLGVKFAREVSLDALEQLLTLTHQLPASPSKPQLEMRFFAAGCMQVVSGTLQPPRLHAKDLCLAYDKGCIHLDPQQLEEAWVVRKPEGERWVTSLEIFDVQGQRVVQLQEHKDSSAPENLLIREIFAALA